MNRPKGSAPPNPTRKCHFLVNFYGVQMTRQIASKYGFTKKQNKSPRKRKNQQRMVKCCREKYIQIKPRVPWRSSRSSLSIMMIALEVPIKMDELRVWEWFKHSNYWFTPPKYNKINIKINKIYKNDNQITVIMNRSNTDCSHIHFGVLVLWAIGLSRC